MLFADDEYGSAGLFGLFDRLQPLTDLLLRVLVAAAYYLPGTSKVASASLLSIAGRELHYPLSLAPTDATLALFETEYAAPLLSPAVLAQLAVLAEIVLPVLLLIGLCGRLSALGLLGYSLLLTFSFTGFQASSARYLALLWGAMLLTVLAHGPGKLSVDYLIKRLRS